MRLSLKSVPLQRNRKNTLEMSKSRPGPAV